MRAELRFANGPFVWLAYLTYLCVYSAGFESVIPPNLLATIGDLGPAAIRLGLAALALLSSAYGMVFLEPKDPVRLRWLGEQVRAGQVYKAFVALDCWMLSYAASLAVGLALAALWAVNGSSLSMSVLAMLGFLTRDVMIFVLMRWLAGGKGDFAALAVLGALYLLLPVIARGLGLSSLDPLFIPTVRYHAALGALAAWAQGVGVMVWVMRRIGTEFTSR
jgi:uncharacterized membrane protein